MRDESVVIVTGAAGALGSHAVSLLSGRGARVVAVDLDRGRLDEVGANEGWDDAKVEPVAADVTDAASVAGYVATATRKWGRLDAIFNNAGIQGDIKMIADYDDDEFMRVLRTNLFSVFLGMKHAIPVLIDHGGGAIVNTGSSLGYRGWEEVPAYVAAKHGVVGITKVAAIELAANRIGVNCLCPSGMAGTEMFRDVATRLGKGDHDAGLAKIMTTLPGGHAATPADAAAVATFLLLDAPSTLSGIIVPVDAAETAG